MSVFHCHLRATGMDIIPKGKAVGAQDRLSHRGRRVLETAVAVDNAGAENQSQHDISRKTYRLHGMAGTSRSVASQGAVRLDPGGSGGDGLVPGVKMNKGRHTGGENDGGKEVKTEVRQRQW